MDNKPFTGVYKADLQHAGTAISESIIILSEYLKHREWNQLKASVLKKNLLKKRSSVTASNFLRAARRRFFVDHAPLPSADSVAYAMVADMPYVAKTQILYPYVCKADALVEQVVLRLVKPHFEGSFSSNLTKEDVVNFLQEESLSHPELQSWADSLKLRWTRGFLALLRDLGMMEQAPSNKLLKPLVRVEAFSFFLLGLIQSGFSTVKAVNNPLWELYFLESLEIERLLVESQACGWIYYSKAGDVVELKPRHTSIEEWLESGLEH